MKCLMWALLLLVWLREAKCGGNNSYYTILGISPKADEMEIKKAYRKLAMKHHPDKNRTNRLESEKKFKKINEAYECLSDPKKKQVYDLYGDSGIGGINQGSSSGGQPYAGHGFSGSQMPGFSDNRFFSSTTRRSSGGGGTDGQWFQTSEEGDLSGMFQDIMEQFLKSRSPPLGRQTQSGFGTRSRFGTSSTPSNTQTPEITISVDCTLNDLYNGKTKNLKVTDSIFMHSQHPLQLQQQSVQIEKVFKVDIQKGYKKGTKIKYPASDDFPKSVSFVINELPHKFFTRKGNDLKWKCSLTGSQIEKGVLIKIPLLNGTALTIDSKDYDIKHNTKIPFKGLGMPYSVKDKDRDSSSEVQYGDLIIKFEVK